MKTSYILATALSLLMPLAAAATSLKGPPATGINAEIRQALVDARKEARADLAEARQQLDTENLDLGKGLPVGTRGAGKRERVGAEVPRGEVTPRGDFLIDGKAQRIDLSQRRQLLAYRGLVLEIAKAGIDIGERTANAVLNEVDGHWFGLMFSALTGNLERRVERMVRLEVEPGVRGICRLLPRVLESQQRLSSSLPKFKPYATLERNDVDGCEDDVRRGFAAR